MNLSLTYRTQFHAWHRLTGMEQGHKCAASHPHTYSLEITLEPMGMIRNGLICDSGALRVYIAPVIARIDGTTINDAEISGPEAETLKAQPSCENLARWFFAALGFLGNDGRMLLRRVRVYESDHLWAEASA